MFDTIDSYQVYLRTLIISQAARDCNPVITATHHSSGMFCDFLLFSATCLGIRPLNRSSCKMA